jgi:lipase chaperone LimK
LGFDLKINKPMLALYRIRGKIGGGLLVVSVFIIGLGVFIGSDVFKGSDVLSGSKVDPMAKARNLPTIEIRNLATTMKVEAPLGSTAMDISSGLSTSEAIQQQWLDQTKSWSGSLPDGHYSLDRHGNLLITQSIKRRFHYWLIASGELDKGTIYQLMVDDIVNSLRSPAREQALALLERYWGYLQSLQEQLQTPSESLDSQVDFTSPIERFQWIKAERRRWFGEEVVQAFFAQEEQATEQQLNHYQDRFLADQDDQAGKQVKVKTAENGRQRLLPWRIIVQDWLNEPQQLLNASDPSLSVRFETLKQQRAQWFERIENYQRFYQGWKQNSGDLQLLQEYEQTHFSSNERKRLSAYQ